MEIYATKGDPSVYNDDRDKGLLNMVINTKFNLHDSVLYENVIYKVEKIEVIVITGELEVYYEITNENKDVVMVMEDELLPLPS